MLVVDDDAVEKIIESICETAVTGSIGDGKIFVSTIDEVVRVRTRERGSVAL